VGFLPFFVGWIPAAAIAPILVYIGLEAIAQAYHATPQRHGLAVAISLLPSLAFLAVLLVNSALGAVGASVSQIAGETGESLRALNLLSNGFIITAILWGAATADLVDRRFRSGGLYLVIGAVFSLFGIIHSPMPDGSLVAPWRMSTVVPWHLAAGYLIAAVVVGGAGFLAKAHPEMVEQE
jgi:AGZA family xanthine/uracil permease-like MFS transporter